MIIIHAEFQVDPAKQAEFLEGLQPLIAASREESGNISYTLHKAVEKENTFTMVEVWQDEEAVALHNKSEHFTSFVSQAKNFLAAPLSVKAYAGQPIEL
ncbi:putative quinol monooxygenase [Domibacillus indicus]|uniref:putative quinol monooxygenase n=1 Tax=Domibacillus indicus TaxID=1437523 RepID=UPI00061822E6|nr:putative quinol monooxygenase [Domibacillus indicus]